MRPFLPVVLVLALALGLRLYRLDGQSFWIDEVYQVRAASEPLSDLLRGVVLRAEGGPLSLLLTHFALSPERLEWSARLPSALFGTAGVLVLYLVAAELVPPPVPLVSALLLACSPLHLWYSQEARWYAQWVPTTGLSYLALVFAIRTRRLVPWLAYGALTVLALYTFVLGIAVVACQALSTLWMWRLRNDKSRLPRGAVWVGVGALVMAAPILWLILQNSGAVTGTRGRPAPLAALPYTLFTYTVGFSFGPTLEYLHHYPTVADVVARHPEVLVVAALIAPLLLLGVRKLRETPEALAVVLPWLCGPPLLIFLLASVTNVAYNVRYTLAALPAFTLTLAAGIAALSPRSLRAVALVAVLECFAMAIANYFFDPRFAKEDVRGALAAVRSATARSVPVVALGQIAATAGYYGADLQVVPFFGCDDFDARLGKVGLGTAPALWVVHGRDFAEPGARCLIELRHSFEVERTERLNGVDAQLLERVHG